MRCKRHTTDSTSTIGVCSSCLRERLLSLAASAAIEDLNNNNHHNQSKKSKNPPLLIFPRSVSPYVTRRKSDVTATNRRFITTAPQVDLVGISCKDFESSSNSTNPKQGNNNNNNKKSSRFSSLFRARSQDLETDQRFSRDDVSISSSSAASASSSRSWFNTILSGGRRSKNEPDTTTTTTTCYIEDVIGNNRRPQRVFCRGMSPARDLESEDVNDVPEETPGRLKNTPAKTPGRKKSGNGLGMGFCLSPLVRASPNCPFKRKMRFSPSEFGNSGEVTMTATATEKPHISAAASFCANRSKKLVDLGRVNRRR